jgi:hypothetical protein
MTNLRLFFINNQDHSLIGYVDVGYLFDPQNALSQTGTAIFWKSSKQTLAEMSTNHSEIIVLYETSRECIWLRGMIDHI